MAKQGSNGPIPPAPVAVTDPAHVMELVKKFDFLSIGLGGKIHCALTNRDLPLRVDAVQQHLNSKKLKKEREWWVLYCYMVLMWHPCLPCLNERPMCFVQ